MRLRALLTVLIGVLSSVLVAPMAAATAPEVLVAHRGVAGDAQLTHQLPENSIPAWDWAVRNCANIIDMDAQVTGDGYLAVMHDATIDRTTNGTGRVDAVTLDYIKSRWLELPQDLNGNGDDDNTPYHPPSLNQALDFLNPKRDCGGQPIKMDIEMKGGGWSQAKVTRLADVLKSKGMFTERVNVHAISSTVVGYAKAAGFPNRGYVVPAGSALPPATTVLQYGTNVFLDHRYATAAKVAEYSNAGIRVWLSAMDSTAEYDKAWALSGSGKVYAWVVNDLLDARDYLQQAT
jgi:glycerophosphoryl diester phosphodiesterase